MADRDTSTPSSVCENTRDDSHSGPLQVVRSGNEAPFVFCGFHARFNNLAESLTVARDNRMQWDAMDLDEDGETCSWCTREVPDVLLTTVADGARLCLFCLADHLSGGGK